MAYVMLNSIGKLPYQSFSLLVPIYRRRQVFWFCPELKILEFIICEILTQVAANPNETIAVQ